MNPSIASDTPAATNTQKAAWICAAMMSQIVTGTASSRPRLMALGMFMGPSTYDPSDRATFQKPAASSTSLRSLCASATVRRATSPQ